MLEFIKIFEMLWPPLMFTIGWIENIGCSTSFFTFQELTYASEMCTFDPMLQRRVKETFFKCFKLLKVDVEHPVSQKNINLG